ncbi:MAG: hypothetical protein GY820_17095 [Gammaproteobacteria bacterium]|nr:hypothetical protein [Gammaproteobacteria bacterium]
MTQETIKSEHGEGEVKAVNEVSKDKVQSIHVKVDGILFRTCQVYYANKFNNRHEDLKVIKAFGLLGQTAKQSVNMNNKAFKAWRERHFPELTADYFQYSINIITHIEDIEKWIEKTDCEVKNRDYSNPRNIYDRFNGYKKNLAAKKLEEMEVEQKAIEETAKVIEGIGSTDTKPSKEKVEVTEEPIKSGIDIQPQPLTAEEMYVTSMQALNAILTRANEGKWDIEEKTKILGQCKKIVRVLEEKLDSPIEKIAKKKKGKK